MSTHTSKACCTIPPVEGKDYTTKGKYLEWDGLKVYVTGSESATKALFYIYDIFGFTSQTLQGADILAEAGNYLVVVPDFFEGKYAGPWFFGSSDEDKEKQAAFRKKMTFKTEEIKSLLKHANSTFPSATKWGAIGYCWGGKVASVNSGANAPWSVAVSTSPAMVDPADAEKLTIPFATLASKDEPADKVKAFGEAQKTPKLVEFFNNEPHGFMSAR